MAKKPEVIYAAFFNKGGFLSKEPDVLRLREDKACWLGTELLGCVTKVGLDTNAEGDGRWFYFSSESYDEVRAFILGARSVLTVLISRFGEGAFKPNEYQSPTKPEVRNRVRLKKVQWKKAPVYAEETV